MQIPTSHSTTASKMVVLPTGTDSHEGKVRLALVLACISFLAEEVLQAIYAARLATFWPIVLCAVMSASIPFLLTNFHRLAMAIFAAGMFIFFFESFFIYANHGWLAMWLLPVTLLFRRWWDSGEYAQYVRLTMGIVMIAAAIQKVLAGTYFDGSYIAYLSEYGSSTERLFGWLCDSKSGTGFCQAYIWVGTFIVIWQFVVGVLLIMGLTSTVFLVIESLFLLGAGIYADEMNFQVLNISVLCIAFGVGLNIRYFLLGLFTLALHAVSLDRVVRYFVDYLA